MTPEMQTSNTAHSLTPAERQSLTALRTRFQNDPDLFSDKERAHLLFLRWLYQSWSLTAAPCPATETGGKVVMAAI